MMLILLIRYHFLKIIINIIQKMKQSDKNLR
jgi:hypothetical protein